MTADPRLSPRSLASADLFAGAPVSLLETAAAAARPRRVPRGTRIFNQGDEGARAHLPPRGTPEPLLAAADRRAPARSAVRRVATRPAVVLHPARAALHRLLLRLRGGAHQPRRH